MAALGSASTALRAAHTSRVVTLITGANRGLGFELARQLIRLGGFQVIAAAREWSPVAGTPRALLQDAASEAAKASSRRLGGVHFVELDVASEASRYALLGKLSAVLGTEQRINVVVNNAGVYPPEWTEAAFNHALAVNTVGPLRLATDLVPFYGPDAHVVSRRGIRGAGPPQRTPPPPPPSRPTRPQINVSTGLSQPKLLSPAYRSAVETATTVDALAALRWDGADAMMAGTVRG